MNILHRIRVVLVGTTLPANIGSTARAMHTMGISDLVVVNPKLPIDDTSHANATAGTFILQNARIVATLEEALSDCCLIFASSARSRHLPRPVITPTQGAVMIDDYLSQNTQSHIAIVFGREDRGLTNEELALADFHIQIPANPDYPVLNVASAVQVICASIYAQLSSPADHSPNPMPINFRTDWDEKPISLAQKQQLENKLTDLLITLNLARFDDLKDLPTRLSRLSSRLQLDQKEYALLQALIAKIGQHLDTNCNI